MSYDLMVFNPIKAPKNTFEFMNWFDSQTEWEEKHDYDKPSVSNEKLKNWFKEMIKEFPAMNGPFASNDIDAPKTTDYSVGIDIIYAAFAWSEAENAYTKMIELAEKHKVGFYDVSGSGDILFPNDNEKLEKIFENKPW